MNLVCKLFRFILDIFEGVVTVVASALKTVGSAVVDVLSDIWDHTLGSGNLSGILIGAGLLGLVYFMLTKEEDKKPNNVANSQQSNQPDGYGGYQYGIANNTYTT